MVANEQYWKQLDEAFFKDGYQLCDNYLSMGFNKTNLFAAQKALYQTIDSLIDSFLKRTAAEGQPAECKKGCAFCCHQTVLATTNELLFLQDFLSKKFPSAAFQKLLGKAKEKSEVTSQLRVNKLLKHKQPCPLLHSSGGFCMAYKARPMACRIYLSSSVASCKADLQNPEDDKIYPKLFDMPLRAGRMLNEGFQARIRKDRMESIQVFENTIESGLLSASENQAFDQWLKGKSVFRKIKD